MAEILVEKRTRRQKKTEVKNEIKRLVDLGFPDLLDNIEKIRDDISVVPLAYYFNRQNYGEDMTRKYLESFGKFLLLCDETREQIERILPDLPQKEQKRMQDLQLLLTPKKHGDLSKDSCLSDFTLKDKNVILVLNADIKDPYVNLEDLKNEISEAFKDYPTKLFLKRISVELIEQITVKSTLIHRSVFEILNFYKAPKRSFFGKWKSIAKWKNILSTRMN